MAKDAKEKETSSSARLDGKFHSKIDSFEETL